jgi:hypothetical protein
MRGLCPKSAKEHPKVVPDLETISKINFLTPFEPGRGLKIHKIAIFSKWAWSRETGPTQPNPGFYGLKKSKRHPGVVFRPVRAISENIDFLTPFSRPFWGLKAIFGHKIAIFSKWAWSRGTGPTQPNPGFYGLKKCKRHPGWFSDLFEKFRKYRFFDPFKLARWA